METKVLYAAFLLLLPGKRKSKGLVSANGNQPRLFLPLALESTIVRHKKSTHFTGQQ